VSDLSDFVLRSFGPQTAQAREQHVSGLVSAIVDHIEDDGTYRLKLLGMNGQSDDESSAAARVMVPMAGAKRGIHFFPEVGDEVIVGFLAGDTTHPIVLGGVWNKNDEPPDQAQQSPDNNIRTIVSRSGHELTFDDTAGREKVLLRSESGHQVELNDTPGAGSITIQSAGGRSIKLDDTPPGQIVIQSLTTRITLSDAGGQLSIEATASISLSAPSISLSGASVSITSATGTSLIDGSPYRLHLHPLSGGIPGMTGPVAT
jgi:phage baseplate assembly protein gpV